ncbi:NAD(P)/FAD-dependent oxidoreductase [Mesorhizobium sp. M7A.F.Ca.US.006.04.2.1]|uniref:NAD(P)/FAD-dependent oxidoreductase n=1 Tax=unclassified Mesorhizobium TaxID=325217 RepID=UPI000FCC65C2|nr:MULTISPECIES: NAD(P)/FAD-dependent oxidoreductase [unclassified Mesorhizobium]RUX73831.1 NAD(P)/FAD-dependent oxidoreductase [Mesorhizobium sp. M7A.F.Ca.US.005.03.1.1]RUY16601.1 NAD(P)/FAD-dependent oxidoreductase [Mesorhizobium sp. M7A.F.Ca.US.005.03.2.1]RUY29572.1 NAD(P)/FAD-dependent oxidoreductase [Mesorhizobium sp. M7A.F.Ca.US.001.04.2.1]RUY43030.1 NAD(P)/FAD-dependent oxidoreductase [Mesorhizobium sp. M7A.F.Ca.US.001.04.1.1]RVA02146.1 NAD(P)/FAD-dependent oxidoreductase [Mesorhizobium
MQSYDVVIIGAGAAGMMCAVEAAKRGRSVLILDHAAAPGEKIRISGGGRCNFTNIHASPKNFLSGNPHFCISALSRYTQRDFIALVERHRIAYHEKTLGQLFCDGSARQITDMLVSEMQDKGAELVLSTSVEDLRKTVEGFVLTLSTGTIRCQSLVVACGGKSIPKMGATGFGYELAERFGLAIVETRPALVPLTFDANTLERLAPLAGNAVDAEVACGKTQFSEAMLFTHRGVSGPSILQISSYWREGDEIRIAMLPGVDVADLIRSAKRGNGRQAVQTVLANHLPKRLAQSIAERTGIDGNLADLSDAQIKTIAAAVNDWRIKPAGSEGYRTAEVTLGGVDTNGLDQKTMQAKSVPGLFFIGEAVDVTGWLGGYNFQWAWSSGWVAGQAA